MILLVLRLALAAVFAASAAGKLADRRGTRDAAEEFGVPARLAAVVALALPVAELAVVGLLLVPSTVLAGAVLALGLLALFTAAIAMNLARGRRPACHCFGQIHSEPIGARTLARNAVIAGLAAAVALLPGDWGAGLGGADAAVVVLALALVVLVAVGARLALAMLRQSGRLLERIDRLEAALERAGIAVEDELPGLDVLQVGAAPPFELETVAGGSLSLEDLLAGERPALLVFTDPGCGPCEALAPDIASAQREAGRLAVAVVSGGDRAAAARKAGEHGLAPVLVDADRAVAEAYGAGGTPAAVLVAPDGSFATALAVGEPDVRRLLELAPSWTPPAPGVGDPAPALGEHLATNRDTLVVFWNPLCGFCDAMHDDLVAWERAAGASDPALLVVSTSEDDGFSSTVLLDPASATAERFGADGTPMAVRVAADGTIASPLASGHSEIFALARSAEHRETA
jgi:thiol-disulfide isomerase/thioredoxin